MLVIKLSRTRRLLNRTVHWYIPCITNWFQTEAISRGISEWSWTIFGYFDTLWWFYLGTDTSPHFTLQHSGLLTAKYCGMFREKYTIAYSWYSWSSNSCPLVYRTCRICYFLRTRSPSNRFYDGLSVTANFCWQPQICLAALISTPVGRNSRKRDKIGKTRKEIGVYRPISDLRSVRWRCFDILHIGKVRKDTMGGASWFTILKMCISFFKVEKDKTYACPCNHLACREKCYRMSQLATVPWVSDPTAYSMLDNRYLILVYQQLFVLWHLRRAILYLWLKQIFQFWLCVSWYALYRRLYCK